MLFCTRSSARRHHLGLIINNNSSLLGGRFFKSSRSSAAAPAIPRLISPKSLQLTLSSPSNSSVKNLSSIWLRDNCPCPTCIHPSNGQKLHSSGDQFIREAAIERIDLVGDDAHKDGKLRIFWKQGVKHDQGPSLFDLNWLTRFCFETTSGGSKIKDPSYWDRATLEREKGPFRVSYKDYINNPSAFKETLSYLYQHGLVFVHGIPSSPSNQPDNDNSQSIRSLVEQIGPIRNSFYGVTWDVKSIPQSNNIAYTSLYLGLHMDLMYFECPPGLQFLHALHNSVAGGENWFVDAAAAANTLALERPDAFAMLTKYPVTFHYRNGERRYQFHRPTISPDPYLNQSINAFDFNHSHNYSNGELNHWLIYYAPPFMGPLQPNQFNGNLNELEKFYEAFAAYEKILNRPAFAFEKRLNPGECVIFHNRRVLHARRSFTESKGERHFKGAYLDYDDFRSKLAYLFDL